ncbi:MAG: site-2 protease family protein [Candidatus Micrarchaeia archaeon]
MSIRENVAIIQELKDIVIADLTLTLAFAIVYAGRLGGIISLFSNPAKFAQAFAYYLPMAFVAVSLVFVLHELMHKFTAQHYGAIAGFKASRNGLLITIATGAFGFLLGIPGATVIYAHNFSKREMGIVALAGPLVNFAIFAIFLALYFLASPGSYVSSMFYFVMFVSILLAFFNMLPAYPLDGSKVLAWNKKIYAVSMLCIFALMYLFTGLPLSYIIMLVIIAYFISTMYRGIGF